MASNKTAAFFFRLTLVGSFVLVTPVTAQPIIPANDDSGTIVNPDGNRLDITGGQRSGDGANLFHGFQEFNVNSGQIANFISSPEILNILARIKGGNPSYINGLIQITGGNSNLFLMNPSGIIFGTNASLNVPGAFTATTANGIGFNNNWFNAIGNNNYAALIGKPNAFAFGMNQPGSIVNAGNLSVGIGQDLTLIAGTVINTGQLTAPEGNITIAAIPGSSLVRLSQPGYLLGLEIKPIGNSSNLSNNSTLPVASLPQMLTGGSGGNATGVQVNQDGSIELTGSGIRIPQSGTAIASGNINVTGKTGGSINVLGDKVGVIGGNINASGTHSGGVVRVGGDERGKGDVPNASRTFVSKDSAISADSLIAGNGGRVIVWGDEATRFYGMIAARGGKLGGNGGFAEVSGKEYLDFAGKVDLSAPQGLVGNLLLDPTNITIVAGANNPAELTANDQFADPGVNNTINNGTINAANANVTLQATNDINFTAPVNITNAGVAITAQANNNINVNADITTNGGVVDLNADADNIGGGTLTISAAITTNGGDVRGIGRGFGAATRGVFLSTGTINAGGGNINFTGIGGNSGGGNYGILIQNNSTLTTSGSGTIALTGTGGNGIDGNYGILIDNSNLNVADGNIILLGTGNGTGLGNNGIRIANTTLTSTGMGAIDLTGTGSSGMDFNYGIYLTGGNLNTKDGNITLSGTGNGSGASNYGIAIDNSSNFTSAGTGAIALTGTGGNGTSNNYGISLTGSNLKATDGNIALTGTGGDGTGSGNNGILFSNAVLASMGTGAIALSGTGGNGTSNNYGISLTGSNLNATDGNIALSGTGGNGSGTNNYGISIQNSSALTSTGTGAIAIAGTGGNGNGSSFGTYLNASSLNAVDGNITLSGTGGDNGQNNYGIRISNSALTSTGTGALSLTGTGGNGTDFNRGIFLLSSDLNAADGNITLSATSKGIGINNEGIYINSASLRTIIGKGSIDLTGISGNGGDDNFGIYLQASSFNTADGNITFTGTGNGNGQSNSGIRIENISTLSSTGTGAIDLSGTGGNGTNANIGIDLLSSNLNTTDGNITLTGTGNGTGTDNYGISVSTNSALTTTGTGKIELTGTGGSGVDGNSGIYLLGSNLNVVDGNITLAGTGNGTGTDNYGIRIGINSGLTSTGTGAIDLAGAGGNGTDNNNGVQIADANLNTANGNLTITGTGGNGTGQNNRGIHIQQGSTIASNGTGAIALTGTGGNGININIGISLNNSNINTADGNITLAGTGNGTGKDNYGILIKNASTLTSTGTGAIAVSGTGSNGTNNNYGIYLIGSNLNAADGNLALTGTSNGTGTDNYGILIDNTSALTTTGASAIELTGTGGNGTNFNTGIFLSLPKLATNDRDITINGNTILDNDITISSGTGAGDISFSGTIDGNINLTIEAGTGNITFNSAVGSNERIGNLTFPSANNINTADLTAASITQTTGNGTTNLQGNLNTDSPTGINLIGKSFNINGNVTTTNGGTLTINNSNNLTLSVNPSLNLDGAFNQIGTGAVSLAGNITTTDDNVNFTSAVTLTGNTNINTGPNAGDISFSSTLDGNYNLTTDAGAGNVTFNNAIGNTNPLSTLDINGQNINLNSTTKVAGNIDIDATGILNLNNSVTTTNNGSLTLTNSKDLTIKADNFTLDGAFTQDGIGSVFISGNLITTNDNISFSSPVTLIGSTVFNPGTATVSFSSTLTASSYPLNLRAGEINFTGEVTGSNTLTLEPATPTQNIILGGTTDSSTSSLDLTSTDINALQPGFSNITIGRPDGNGAINSAGDVTFNSPITLQSLASGGVINTADFTINGANNSTINLIADRDIKTGNIINPGRAINLTSNNGSIDTSSGQLNTSNIGGNAGEISLQSPTQITTGSINSLGNLGTGNITLTSNQINFNGFSDSVKSKGNILLQPFTDRDNLTLSSPNINALADGFNSITIGRSNGSGTISTFSTFTFSDPVTFQSPNGSIIVYAPIKGIDNASITFTGMTKLLADITTANQNILVYGNMTIANEIAISTSNDGAGMIIINGTIDGNHNLTLNTGTGNIIIGNDIGTNNRLGNLTINSTNDAKFKSIAAASITQKSGTGTTTFAGKINTNTAEGINLTGNNFTFTNSVTTTENGSVSINPSVQLNIPAKAPFNLAGGFNQTGSGQIAIASDITTANQDIKFSGPVTLNGEVNFNLGTAKISFGSSLAAGNNPLTLTASEIDFGGAVTGTNNLILQPATATQNIAIGSFDNNTDALDLTSNEINFIQKGFSAISIGRTDSSSAITIDNNVTFKSPVTIQSPATGGSITAKGIINLESVGLELKSDRHIVTNSIISNGGNITLTSQTGEINTSSGKIDSSSTNGAGGNVNLIASSGAIATGDINSSASQSQAGQINLNANNNIITSNITARSDTNAGGNITLNSQQGSIESGNLNASGNTLGGEIRVLTPVQITTKQINSSAITGNGGNVTLDPLGDIQVEYINAQGGTAGTGGNVDITTARFFRATGSFADRNGLTSSISTAGGTGGGSIAIRHGGGPNTAFNVVGDASTNGTVGNITTGTGTDQTLTPGAYFGPFTQGQTQVITEGAPLSPEEPTTPPPVVQEPVVQQPTTPTPVIQQPVVQQPTTPTPVVQEPVVQQPTTPTPVVQQPTTPTPVVQQPVVQQPTTPTPVVQQPVVQQPVVQQPTTPTPVVQQPVVQQPTTPPQVVQQPVVQQPTTPPQVVESTQNLSSNDENKISIDMQGITVPSTEVGYSNLVGRSSLDTTLILRDNITSNLQKGNVDVAVLQIEQLRQKEYQNYFGEELIISRETYLSVEQIQNILKQIASKSGKQPAILYVFVQPKQLDLVLVTPTGKPIYRRVAEANSKVLHKVISEFRGEITDPTKRNTTSYLNPAQKLYQWLIAPIESELQSQKIDTLAFSLDAGLRTTPLAALHDGQKFLIQKYSIGLIPSVNLIDTSYEDVKQFEVLAMGAEKFTNLAPLPAVPLELATIAQHIWKGKFFLNEEFTPANLKSQRAGNSFRIIHLATHGEFKPGQPNNSYIHFWNSRLSLDRLRQLDWNSPPVELLVLSACRTAVGDEQAELGFGGLAVAAGVKSALASLWYVSDRGTLALMTEFYEHLKNVPIKAEALQQAQIAMIKEEVKIENDKLFGLSSQSEGIALPAELTSLGNQKLSHPYYWSAFTMIGSPW